MWRGLCGLKGFWVGEGGVKKKKKKKAMKKKQLGHRETV